MTRRTLLTAMTAFAVALWASSAAVAEDAKPGTHEGMVVKAGEGKLTMTDKDGKNEHTHDVAEDAKIAIDGKEAKLADLKKGAQVKVTTEKKGDKTMVVKVEAKKETDK
jgi:Cu/Ag efflux protein CusF